ncbi:MAG TPA: hypothetical protein DFS52_03465 [Myxococcales bacterium]|jgi:uncharacterized membrane protein YebE (DUF533 family)|nr:hypothetical protein [Myxococcales bacterium]
MTFGKKHQKFLAARQCHVDCGDRAERALVETMCLAACVDGRLESGEAVALARQILATPGFENCDPRELACMVEKMVDRVASEGIEARVKAIAADLGEEASVREEAFALATLFVLFDHEVRDEEQALLDALQKALGISDESTARISALLAEA